MNQSRDILKAITKLIGPIIIIFGLFITLHGQVSIGSGVEGGIMIAIALILILLAYGKEEINKAINLSQIFTIISIISICILGLASVGMLFGSFFVNFIPRGIPFEVASGGLIPVLSLFISMFVSLSLFYVFLLFSSYKNEKLGGK